MLLPLQLPVADNLRAHARALKESDYTALPNASAPADAELQLQACGLELDFSRQLIDSGTLSELIRLAEAAGLPAAMKALQSGKAVNRTEKRPALHTALRAPTGARPDVDQSRELMRQWCQKLRGGEQTGFSGEIITDVVNIGIGGSDLGPRLVADALGDGDGRPRCHFVANIDPQDLKHCLSTLSPERTLFIICSKSFRTEETRVNALAARAWLQRGGATTAMLSQHFIAISSNLEAAEEFGIPASNCLPMWDWVGGRYSLWSAVGLSAAIAMGWPAFEALLAGAAAMDAHTLTTAPGENLPLVGALLDCWNSHFLGTETLAVLPYSHQLRKLPDYLQQLVMESNGKGVSMDGQALRYHSAPILWGSAGTIGQHSFHQLLHQGTRSGALELILPLTNRADPEQHARLVAHCLAQSAVFADGRSIDDARDDLIARGESVAQADALAPHLSMPGHRPHSLLSFSALSPYTLGALLAFWEHRTFYNACLLGINAFDQWGVEMGKVVSGQIQEAMTSEEAAASSTLDPVTKRLLQRWREANQR